PSARARTPKWRGRRTPRAGGRRRRSAEAFEAGEELLACPRGWPWLDLEVERLDAVQLRPRPGDRGDPPALGCEGRPVHRPERRRGGGQSEALADRDLERPLGLRVQRAELAPVLERVREVSEVGLGGVVQEPPERVLVAGAFLDQVGDEARMLGDGVEPVNVA